MSDRDDDLFLQEMRGVARLPESDRVSETGRRRTPSLSQRARRAAAVNDPRDGNPLTLPDRVPEVGPHDIVGLKKNGVQEGVYRKFRLGKYDIQSRLDLHRLTLKDAREQVYDFIRAGLEAGLRTVVITHGKGYHSVTPGRMKSHVIYWLEQLDEVLAFHSAQPFHGGAGATYVMLRKSAGQRQRNREFFSEAPKTRR